MSDKALEQRRRNIAAAVRAGKLKRLRSDCESRAIKLFTWQSLYGSGPRPSERTLARQLRVRSSYIHKLLRNAQGEGIDALLKHGERVTLADLEQARQFTKRLREQEPGLLAPAPPRRLCGGESRVLTADEQIAATWREVAEWKRKNPPRYDTRRRIRVPIPR